MPRKGHTLTFTCSPPKPGEAVGCAESEVAQAKVALKSLVIGKAAEATVSPSTLQVCRLHPSDSKPLSLFLPPEIPQKEAAVG